MKEITNFTKKELVEIGNSILSEININLFNAEPTIHKAYQICSELIHEGYISNNKEQTCHKIYKYFKKRTRKNQVREFHDSFGLHLNDRLRAVFTLSFRTSVIEDERIRNVASSVYSILAELKVIRSNGITQDVLFFAIKASYTPRYYENEWAVTLSQLSKKITTILLQKNMGEHNDSITELFVGLDSNQDDAVLEKIKIERIVKAQIGSATIYDSFNDQSLVINRIIKDSEIEFINKTLEIINQVEIIETIETKLFQNDNRHPLVTNFINSTNQYNLIMARKEGNIIEILSELKVTVRAIRETGAEILKIHTEMIQERTDRLEDDIDWVG